MMTGQPIDRIDGPLKVTGQARYAAEFLLPNLAHGVLVQAARSAARITRLDVSKSLEASGVILVLTHENVPRLDGRNGYATGATHPRGSDRELLLLQDDQVRHDRQPIAVVVAETLEQAQHAASLVAVEYDERKPVLDLHDPIAKTFTPKPSLGPADSSRGDADAALAVADVRVDARYTTPMEHHNPIEPHATVATWEGDALTLYDSTQGVFETRQKVAQCLGIPAADVRVVTRFVGGGFGTKGSTWSHTVLTAVAARMAGRPVKLVLDRPQMFGATGHRPPTMQRVALGAGRDGQLTATVHKVLTQASTFDQWTETSALVTRILYACPNMRTSHRLAATDQSSPTFMRAPGESTGTFALESAMDELAEAVGLDPLELRLRNYAERDPDKNLPWSSKSLRACYAEGARRFGWDRRPPAPRSLRDGRWLVGLGMATASYPANRSAAAALARVMADGSALVQSGTQDIGTGTYTVMTQVAADALGLPLSRVRFDLGDTGFPQAPNSGGSQTAASVAPAVHKAAIAVKEKAVALAVGDEKSPLHGLEPEAVDVADGRLFDRADPTRGETYQALLIRNQIAEIEARADSKPGAEKGRFSMHAFGAQFAEVGVDRLTGEVRLRRMLGCFAAGRVLNAKTARSQAIGAMVGGAGMALLEETEWDSRSGRIMNANLGEYLVPVNLDIPAAFDAVFVDEVDAEINELGVKGLGELGITGAAGAIANAVYHASGVRVRDLPVSLEKLLPHLEDA